MALTSLPSRRRDLVLRPIGEGKIVIKDPASGQYFTLEEQEAFLLEQLDGVRGVDEICAAFQTRFDEALEPEDVEQFVDIARGQSLIERPPTAATTPVSPRPLSYHLKSTLGSLLYWRKSFFDPDRVLTWLAPKLSFLWTYAFLACSLGAALWAVFLLSTNWAEFTGFFVENMSWDMLVLAYVTIFLATTLHEFAHGLTCKRYGGEVHEIGFLFMFFLPCLYCNVSDAWLIPEKRKRLFITLAGGYCDLCVFTLGVFVWRIALPESIPYDLAWMLVSVCGLRLFVNFFPLFKLDGYYLLSDIADVPNLRSRALDSFAAHFRWLLWGAGRPEVQPRGRFILIFGSITFCFTIFYLTLMLFGLSNLAVAGLGYIGLIPIGLLAWLVVPATCSGLFKGEFSAMLFTRHKRLVIWLSILAAIVLALVVIRVPDRTGGAFKVRPAARAELRAPVSGFLRIVYADEGEKTSPGGMVAWLEVPDLVSRLAQKEAEVKEAKAKLTLLEAGPRQEEIVEQRLRVSRATGWRDLAGKDLEKKREAFVEEMARLDKSVTQAKSQFEFAAEALERGRKLLEKKALALDSFRDLEKEYGVQKTFWEQAVTQKRERVAVATIEPENELARREKELADAKATLTLMEAGTRPEEIQAEKARLGRLVEEKRYLETVQEKLKLTSPIAGHVITPRLREKIGSYFKEGDLICEIEDPDSLEVEITMEEQDVAKVGIGQEVRFKARALPYDGFHGVVVRIAPQATVGKVQSQMLVVCRIEDCPEKLRSGMTGFGKIDCGNCSLGGSLFSRVFRFVRTEYWW